MIQTEDSETVEPLNFNTADSPKSLGSPTLGVLKFSQLREVFLKPRDSSAYATLLKVGISTDSSPSAVN